MLRKAEIFVRRLASRLVQPVDRWANKDFYNYPLGNAPRADADTYLAIWQKAKSEEYGVIDDFESQSGYKIDEEWFHNLALLTQVVVKQSEICYQHGRLLYAALSSYINEHDYASVNIVETGTARGFSSLCLAKALSDARQPGTIMTFDVLPHEVKMYWNCIADAEGPRSRSELLHDYQQLIDNNVIFVQGDSKLQLEKAVMPRVHFAFLDGAHTYEYVQKEFSLIKDKQRSGDIIFFDDYTPAFFPGVVKAVDEICDAHDYSKQVITIGAQRAYVLARRN